MRWLLITLLIVTFGVLQAMDEQLTKTIIERSQKDDEARGRVVEVMRDQNSWYTAVPDKILNAVLTVDQDNYAFVQQVVNEHGWPGRDLVGEEGQEAFWLLVQHQDLNVALQVETLKHLEIAFNKGEASKNHLAYLTDRVRKNEGKPQVYGTQWVSDEQGNLKLYEVEVLEGLEARRNAMGLSTMDEYRKKMSEEYGI